MADPRRQPEWQQEADRHSTLQDPVLEVRPISRFDFGGRRPGMAIDHGLVFATREGAYDTYIPPHRPSRADATRRHYVSVYEVDMGNHPVRLELELPSDDEAFSFGVTADLTWRAADPEAYVRSGERDVPTRLVRELQQLARPVSRRFPVDDSAGAEEAVQKVVDANGLAAGAGLAVTCLVRLRPDEEAVKHRRDLRALRHESELLAPQHELDIQRARHEYELARLREQQQQELAAAKIDFYRYHLQHGGVGAWALHLAEHPEDTQLVVNSIHQDQLAFVQTQLQLLGGDELEDFQKAEALRQVRHTVDELVRQRAGGPQGQAALPAGAAPVPSSPPYDGQVPGAPYDARVPGPAGEQPYADRPPGLGAPLPAPQVPDSSAPQAPLSEPPGPAVPERRPRDAGPA